MREIKFRAWSKLSNEMSVSATLGSWIYTNRGLPVQSTNPYESDYIVFMQYTGLKDKNGKEIYEGDIFRDKQDEYIVEEALGAYVYYNTRYADNRAEKFEFSRTFYSDYLDMAHDIEVIGNIYENPDLLTSTTGV